MKRIFLIALIFAFFNCGAYAITEDYTDAKAFTNEKGLWGLKLSDDEVLISPQYKKFIPLGKSSFIVQKRGKFGLVDYENNILVPIKYSHVERMLGKYLKIGNGSKFGLYNEKGEELLGVEYSSIDILFGGMFLTCKNYQYGIIDNNGKILLSNVFDDIYMPQPNVMRIKYEGRWYEIEQIEKGNLALPDDIKNIKTNKNYIVTELTENPVNAVGYSAVTFTDYLLKLISSISPAHEKTIDNLMLSQGADAISIYFKLGWIPKYPIVFAKNYFTTVKNPNNGPLSGIKTNLRKKNKNN
ncbi:MAG: WG repeat-containing protein [bacterium]|nr:WG repeat-containing protein [bacterium]